MLRHFNSGGDGDEDEMLAISVRTLYESSHIPLFP